MSTLEHIEKFIGPLSTIIAAIVAATIAAKFARRQAQASEIQAKIARDKLKLDAIDKRIDVMEAAQDMIKYVTNLKHEEIADEKYMRELRRRTLKGKFVFSKATYQHILVAVEKCFEIASFSERNLSRRRMDPRRMPSRADSTARHEALEQHIMLPDILEKDMALELFHKEGENSLNTGFTLDAVTACYCLIFLLVIFVIVLLAAAAKSAQILN